MSSDTSISGRWGYVSVDGSRVARITGWSANETLDSKSEWGDSDSGGYTNRAAGRRGATFSTEGKFDSGDEVWSLFVPGDICEVILGNAPNATADPGAWDGARGAEYVSYNFPRALCLDFKLTVNVDTEEVIGWTADWGSDGEYS